MTSSIDRPRKVNKADNFDVSEYVQSKIGIEPNAWGSKRRWCFLGMMSRKIFEVKSIVLEDFFVWSTAHCQCMKMRTLREDYLDTLERLGIVRVDWNTGTIVWKGA